MSIENLPGEEWRPIAGYESLYEVSNMGRVRSFPRECWNGSVFWINPARIMRAGKNSASQNAYLFVSLNIGKKVTKNHYVHRLVAYAFVPRGGDHHRTEVNHKNADKADNRASNLEWVTRKENVAHASRMGLIKGLRGIANPKSIPVEVVRADGVVVGVFANPREASALTGMCRPARPFPAGTLRVPKKTLYYMRYAFPQSDTKESHT